MSNRSPSAWTALRRMLEDNRSPAGRAFDICIQVLVLISLVGFFFETEPDLSQEFKDWLYWIECATVVIFTIEYVLRIAVARSKAGFIFSFYGLVDLAAIVPFYLSHGVVDLRMIRLLRVFRLMRSLKLLRYVKAVERFRRALVAVREELVLFFLTAGLIVLFAAVGIHYFEADQQPDKFQTFVDCLWWAVVTVTTIGYGDSVPATVGGKIFTCVVALVGLAVMSVPAGLLATGLLSPEARGEEDEAMR